MDDEIQRVWMKPDLTLLDTVTVRKERLHDEIKANIKLIEQTLASFDVEATVIGVNSGPSVTQYELQPGHGVPVRKITALQNDLSLALAAAIRIQAPIPGKPALGIEVPNKATSLVTLREIIQTPTFQNDQTLLSLAIGTDVSGNTVVGDLTRMPHLLIAGATGSGKSVCINALIAGMLFQATPEELKYILIDPKRVEFSMFQDMPHLLVPVVTESDHATSALRWAVAEMETRYKLFASHTVRNIGDFNSRAPEMGLNPLPYIVIVIDELADLMMVAAGEIEELICRIAQLARAVGIHLLVATQRPSADIITGLIKANIPSRIAFAVSSSIDSRVILDETGAEKLLGRGDMLYLPVEAGRATRLQGVFVSDREMKAIIDFWKAQGKPQYQEEIFNVEATVSWVKEGMKRDPLFAKGAHVVATEGRASVSLLQRKLNVEHRPQVMAQDYSFDVVSQFDRQELVNAVNQAQREIVTRYDFKDTGASIDLGEDEITLNGPSEFKLKAMIDVLQSKLVKRQLSLKILKAGPIETAAKGNVRQTLELQQGIDDELARSLVKQIKQISPKVQPRIQGDTIRVSSREKDLLQQVITALKASETQVPLQFINYR